ncbi:RAB11FIP5 [Cervus elaphus hippelaphus]|uniref:RAB11FIP5 n=1 Tax=Cervus elaphus hippelaphus TaxID=46360 RepID=A0A212CVN3_CEREH|nr:RAB11FIP5 [Cervus elaphus hippelaphus]
MMGTKRWYKLHSKAGKKEKERGEIQVTIQFTRNNLSASMFDLSVKDKPRSPFSKIKDKMKGKKKYDLESASAILPSSALEDPELGSLGKMGKAKGFFLRSKLRKSSLTQSNTSLGSDSTLSSASGSLAYQGPGAELLTRSPSRSSWLSSEGGRDSAQSPKLLTHKRTYSDEASQMRAAPPRALLDLQGHLDGASRSSLCVNGSHIYNEEPPAPPRHRSSISGPFPTSSSLHAGSSRPSEEGPRSADDSWARGSRRPSSSEAAPGQEELSSQARVLAVGAHRSGEEEGARPSEGRPVQVATPMVASSEAAVEKEGARKEERKPRMGLFHHHHQGLSRSEMGRRGSLGEKGGPTLGASPHHSSSGEEKAKSSWFGLRETKEPSQKPRALVRDGSASLSPVPGGRVPQQGWCFDGASPTPSLLPHGLTVEAWPLRPQSSPPAFPQSDLAALPHHHPCSPCAPAPPTAPLLSTNLCAVASPAAAAAAAAAAPETAPSGLSGLTNPFLTSLQTNPFFEELIADIALNSPSPAPSLPSASRANPTPLASPGKAPPEWDDTFNIFAASRLRPESRSEILAPPGAGLEAIGLQDPGPGAMTMKAAEPQGGPGGGERVGSSMWPEPRVPLDLGLDCPSTSVADPGPLGSEGACLPPASAQLHPGASASGADRELPAPGGEAGQSPADSATSLFSSPEVINPSVHLSSRALVRDGSASLSPVPGGRVPQQGWCFDGASPTPSLLPHGLTVEAWPLRPQSSPPAFPQSDLAALPHHHPCSPCAPAPPTAPLLSTNLCAVASPAAAAAAAAAAPETAPSGLSGLTNPFLTSLQTNPFFEELIADIALNSPSPAPSLPSASRANPTPLASPGKAPPEWDDTFNIFAASRLRPESRSEILAPPGAGLEAIGLQDPGPGAMTMKAAEPQGGPGGGERVGSSMWPEPRVPLDLGLDCPSTSVADPGPLGSEGACLPPASAQLHPGASASGADRELPAPGGEAGQSPADSATSLFSSPEVISVWERLPGPDGAPEAHQDKETCQGGSQLSHELDTVDDSWPWDVVTVSPAAETTSPVLQGGSCSHGHQNL